MHHDFPLSQRSYSASLRLDIYGITSSSHPDADPQTLLQRCLAHTTGVNVGLHVESYDPLFDCFEFFNAKKMFVFQNVENVVILMHQKEALENC